MTIAAIDLKPYAEKLQATFRTKVAKVERAQTILHGVTLDTPLAGDDLAVILGILAGHPEVTTKVGAGLSTIHVEITRPYGNRGFILSRVDGTTTDFSYLKCLRPDSSKRAVTAGCREAVRVPLLMLRTDWLWSDGTCQLTGLPIDEHNSQVHHAPPMFDSMVAAWAKICGGFDAVGDRMTTGDNVIGDHLSYDDRMSWLAYHDSRAVLLVVHSKANQSIEGARRSIQAS